MTAPPAITFVSSHARLGGEERYLSLLLEGLGPEWVRSVVCLEDGPYVGVLREAGHRVEVVPTGTRAPGIASGAVRLRRLLARQHPALVHANGVKAAVVSALATSGSRVPLLWLKHDFSFDGRIGRWVGARSRLVVGVSRAVTETFGGAANVRVVNNGLPPLSADRTEGRRRLEKALGLPGGGPIVMLMARIDPLKGHGELVSILPELLELVPGTRVAFMGEEYDLHRAYAERIRREIAGAGVTGSVAFLGYRSDAVELLAGSDVLVIPTVVDAQGRGREGFPYAALEALAVGTVVVGYARGGLPELLGDCGVLVQPDDRAALREGLVRVLSDPAERKRLAACGRERVRERFGLEPMIEAMKAHYLEVARP
ncbi:MAG TPA: glycosyltransferase [Gaiellaceae bacterium]|nr:glycosyltransferase [Gaiellaceae bacterium]